MSKQMGDVSTLHIVQSPVCDVVYSPEPENGLIRVCWQEPQAGYMAEYFTFACVRYKCFPIWHKMWNGTTSLFKITLLSKKFFNIYVAKWWAHSLQLKY